jgi:hypothetical protein
LIVVDTSVWVDLLNGKDTSQARRCTELIEDGAPIALTDIILTEVLQGLSSDEEAALVEARLRFFPIVTLHPLDDHVLAAHL